MSARTQLAHRIADRRARVGVVGLGYVGLSLARRFENAGFTVTGFDRLAPCDVVVICVPTPLGFGTGAAGPEVVRA